MRDSIRPARLSTLCEIAGAVFLSPGKQQGFGKIRRVFNHGRDRGCWKVPPGKQQRFDHIRVAFNYLSYYVRVLSVGTDERYCKLLSTILRDSIKSVWLSTMWDTRMLKNNRLRVENRLSSRRIQVVLHVRPHADQQDIRVIWNHLSDFRLMTCCVPFICLID